MPAGKGLYSYFSPVSGSTTPRKSSKGSPSGQTPHEAAKRPRTIEFDEFDVVWGRIEGDRLWPGIVCRDPITKTMFRRRKRREWNLFFFGNPQTRMRMGWVDETDIREYDGVTSEVDQDAREACKEADQVQKKGREERKKHVITEEEEEEEEEEINSGGRMKRRKSASAVLSAHRRDKKRRRRIIMEDSSDDDEEEEKEEKDDEKDDTPLKKKSLTSSPAVARASSKKAATSLARFQRPQQGNSESSGGGGRGGKEEGEAFLHENLIWLKETHRKDGKGRVPTHPEFESCTLYVPGDFLKKQTPGMQQWWRIKSENFDTVIFFKVGKFYELYHMDAVIGVKELGLLYMKGAWAHAGFPEISFGRYSDALVQKGYRVARVEQTETPSMMEERIKKGEGNKSARVVRRELCAVITKGTRTYSFLEGECSNAQGAFLLSIAERAKDDVVGGESIYGVCFVDTSIGKFHIGQFCDDRLGSRLRTLIAHYPPVQVLYERGKSLSKTQHIIHHCLSNSLQDALVPGSEFWTSKKTLKFITEQNYIKPWPGIFEQMLSPEDSLGLTSRDEWDLGLSALGAVTWYLKKCQIDEELLSLAQFDVYTPLDCCSSSSLDSFPRRLILDDVTLRNLEVVRNNWDGSTSGTLLETLDHCVTSFGKRLLKEWICSPLSNPDAIRARQDAVDDVMQLPGEINSHVINTLKGLPDLERLIRRIHSLGSPLRSSSHPDSRAVMYEALTYGKKKINDFLSAIGGFEKAQEMIQATFEKSLPDFKSRLLKEMKFPDMTSQLEFFQTAFNHDEAKKDGVITPRHGVDLNFDEAVSDVKKAELELEKYLNQQKKEIGSKQVTYMGSGRTRYQLEVPDSFAQKLDTSKYELHSQRKGFKRFYTKSIKRILGQLTDAEERRDLALKDTMRRLFHEFDKSYDIWNGAVQCLAVLDVLFSLARYSVSGDGVTCRPEIIFSKEKEQPFIEIISGRHPCISHTFSGDSFIPNDVRIGTRDIGNRCVVIVTGPNMGGKSTLMRQTGILVIMAQLGCYVPCESCRLTPVDRIFTRLGARDRIMAGESTFYVELSETSSILQYATKNSLILLDELGRGTSTYDGAAIACAVVNEIAHIRTLFSTHYHSLVEQFVDDERIYMGHMACMVENDDDSDDLSAETITFLYKFVEGACPKSHGFNAARLAGIPHEIVKLAMAKAKQLEARSQMVKLIRSITEAETETAITEMKKNLETVLKHFD